MMKCDGKHKETCKIGFHWIIGLEYLEITTFWRSHILPFMFQMLDMNANYYLNRFRCNVKSSLSFNNLAKQVLLHKYAIELLNI